MILHDSTWFYMVLHGSAWFCMVLLSSGYGLLTMRSRSSRYLLDARDLLLLRLLDSVLLLLELHLFFGAGHGVLKALVLDGISVFWAWRPCGLTCHAVPAGERVRGPSLPSASLVQAARCIAAL